MEDSVLMRWTASCDARSVIDNRGVGNGAAAEHGDTDREDSLVAAMLDPIDGDRGESKVKLSSNILAMMEGLGNVEG
jgi:hypothetical protein